MIYIGGWRKTKLNEEEKISKIEGQIWLGLRELLLNPKSASYYEITKHRYFKLLKVFYHYKLYYIFKIVYLYCIK